MMYRKGGRRGKWNVDLFLPAEVRRTQDPPEDTVHGTLTYTPDTVAIIPILNYWHVAISHMVGCSL